jgi:hypothetical protein
MKTTCSFSVLGISIVFTYLSSSSHPSGFTQCLFPDGHQKGSFVIIFQNGGQKKLAGCGYTVYNPATRAGKKLVIFGLERT